MKLIKTEQKHAQALARLTTMMDANPTPGSGEADELDVLALLVERYEQSTFQLSYPIPPRQSDSAWNSRASATKTWSRMALP